MKINNKDLLRYSKQIILKKIGISGQKKILSAKVLVVGAGGLGCPLLLYLAATGVGNIGIVDHDKVELPNLNRQILFGEKDIGKHKVKQVKKYLKNINRKIRVDLFNLKLGESNIEKTFKKYNIICDCTDNFLTRYLINDYCLKNKKILISSAISKFDGHIFNFDFKKKIPCYRCFMPEIPSIERNCETDGILSTTAGIAGTLQANEVIKSILNVNNDLTGKIMIFNALTLNMRKVKLTKNSNCNRDCKKR